MQTYLEYIQCFRFFDLGHEIDLARAQSLLSFLGSSDQFQFKRGTKSVILNETPLILYFEDQRVDLGQRTFNISLTAKMWNFGALSLSFKVPVPKDLTEPELLSLADSLADAPIINSIAHEKAQSLIETLGESIKKPSLWNQNEEYLVFIDRRKGASLNEIQELLSSDYLAQLVMAEPRLRLSDQMKAQLRSLTLQYSNTDMLTVDWNCAYLITDEDVQEICDVLEFANVQLLELRYYDWLLDKKLNSLFKELLKASPSFFNDRYQKLNREASQIYLEASDVVERIENAFKVVG
ncbi:MAG: hypothetical protein KDD50_05515, partial [Bdellovibrionales bacterium]|nr:hypothetical protein [Bdellovibrionales bacterium]